MALTQAYYTPQNPYYNVQPYAQAPAYQQQVPQQQNLQGIIWVDGEIAAKAFQFPAGWDTTKALALWDINEPIIYIKSFNQMGIPNPMQKAHYSMDDAYIQKMLPVAQSNEEGILIAPKTAEFNFATKEDMEKLKTEIKEMLNEMKPVQTTTQNMQNRGGNK